MPLKVIVPPGEIEYAPSPFVTVAVQVSEMPSVPVEGEHASDVIEVAVTTVTVLVEEYAVGVGAEPGLTPMSVTM